MAATAVAVATPSDQRAGRYLAFRLGPEEFAVPVGSVREILGLQPVTTVPHAPAHVLGVLNLRGRIIPVIDLRLRCGLLATPMTERTCIVVVQVSTPTGTPLPMGLVVDAVQEVTLVTAAEIEDMPVFGDGAAPSYLLGVAKQKEVVRLLLDIDRLLGATDAGQLASLLGATSAA